MLRATQLQVRLVAIATALLLLTVGLLARHHEAEMAHVSERSGRVVHAHALSEHHEPGTTAHLHGREAHAHAGDCSLLALAHAPLLHTAPFVVATPVAARVSDAAPAAPDARRAIAAYRFAPKTSPPSA